MREKEREEITSNQYRRLLMKKNSEKDKHSLFLASNSVRALSIFAILAQQLRYLRRCKLRSAIMNGGQISHTLRCNTRERLS